jgi:hypothetical protein
MPKQNGPAGCIGPKSQIAYHLSQAILALGKDDLSRVASNLKEAQCKLDEYKVEREKSKSGRTARQINLDIQREAAERRRDEAVYNYERQRRGL